MAGQQIPGNKPKKKVAKKRPPKLGPNVEQAMADAAIAPRDERGLMPLEPARDIVRSATAFVRGDADRLWAALLSLADADELVREASRLEWRYHPRGKDNTAIVERYGADILPWIAGRVRDDVLVDVPWCLGCSLLAIGTPAAFELVWNLRGYDDSSELVAWELQLPREVPADELVANARTLRDAWIHAHEPIALVRLAELAEAGDEHACAWLSKRARAAPKTFRELLTSHAGADRAATLATRFGFPTALTDQAILERLDDAANAGDWPVFYYNVDGRVEYFAMRLVAARAQTGDAWGVVIQTLCGSYPDALRIDQLVYGSEVAEVSAECADIEQVDWDGDGFHGATVTGWADELVLDEGLIDEQDLRFGRCCEIGYHPYRVAVIRAYLAANPEWWPPAKDALAVMGLGKAEIIADTTRFQHVLGSNARVGTPDSPWEIMPSESRTYRSLAKAIAARDPSAFEPGESNVDWRLHAHTDEAAKPPWLGARFDGAEGGWVAAAMREAVVTADARGLLPLADARTQLAGMTRYERGTGARLGTQWVQGSDRTWAALLSLEHGAELADYELAFAQPVRGAATNTALAERYGAAAIPWLHQFVRDEVLHDTPGCLRATLLHIADGAALEFLVGLAGFAAPGVDGSPAVQLAALVDDWLAVDPARIAALARIAAAGDPRAKTLLRSRALLDDAAVRAAVTTVTGNTTLLDEIGVPRELSAEHVLARLDRAASGAAEDLARWPRFFYNSYPGKSEYHGMRLFAAREQAGDRWAVVIERLTGYNPLRVEQFRYSGSDSGHVEDADRKIHFEFDDATITGPLGTVPFDREAGELAQLTEAPDYWAKREARGSVIPLRSYLAAYPTGFYADAATLAQNLVAPVIIVDTIAFQHAEGPEAPADTEHRPTQIAPSASPAYRSLADAIARRDPAAFDPGAPNTDWRPHARFAPEGEPESDDD
jgi:hypothetical protein